VIPATSNALVDTGEHPSPKKAPDKTAPPVSIGLTPIVEPMEAQITPIVAEVPKDVPVRTESPLLRRKVIRRKTDGLIRVEALETIKGIVPEALQRAVITPIRIKVINILLTVLIPLIAMDIRDFQENPLCLP
jgi:hypothetical protein